MDYRLNAAINSQPEPFRSIFRPSVDCQSNDNYSSDHSSMQSPSSSNNVSERSSTDSQLSLQLQASFSSVFSEDYSSRNEGKIRRETCIYRCVDTLYGHVGLISCIAVSGEWIFSGSQGNDIRAWKLHHELHEHTRFGSGDGAVKALLVTKTMVISAHQDRKIRVWNRPTGKSSAYKMKTAMPTVKDYLSKFMDQRNYVKARRNHKYLWIEHTDCISCLAAGSKNDLLYSGSWDKTVKVWRLSDFRCTESINAHNDAINSLALGPQGFLYTASADGSIKVWRKPGESMAHLLVATLEGHKSSVNSLTVSGDGSLLYSGGSDCAILAWETEIGGSKFNLACKLLGHRHAVLCVFSVGDLLCSGSTDRTIRIWRRECGNLRHSCISVMTGHRGPVKCIAASEKISNSGYFIYSGSLDGSIKAWWVSQDGQDYDCNSDRNHSEHVLEWIR